MKTRNYLLLALLLILCPVCALAAGGPTLACAPEGIDIGTFYNGTTLTVTGTVPADSEAVVRFQGEPTVLHMKEKAKVMGLLWMNVNPVVFRNVPEVFIVSSAAGVGSELGVAGLRERITLEADHADRAVDMDSLIKLKKKEGLFRDIQGNIRYEPAINGMKAFTAEVPLPSRLVPGQYTLQLSAVRDGVIVAETHREVSAQLREFPLLISKLAFGHSALYGVMASILAIIAGLVIGMFFQSKEAH